MVMLNSSPYLKASEVTSGDIIKIETEGQWIESTKYKYPDGNFRVNFIIDVTHKGQSKKLRMNKTNRDSATKSYGDDTANWIGKLFEVTVENIMVSGEMTKTLLLSSTQSNEETIINNPKKENPIEAWDE